METQLNKASNELRSSVDQALTSIGDLNTRMSASEKRMDRVVGDLEALVEKKVEEGLKQIGLPHGGECVGVGDGGSVEEGAGVSLGVLYVIVGRGDEWAPPTGPCRKKRN